MPECHSFWRVLDGSLYFSSPFGTMVFTEKRYSLQTIVFHDERPNMTVPCLDSNVSDTQRYNTGCGSSSYSMCDLLSQHSQFRRTTFCWRANVHHLPYPYRPINNLVVLFAISNGQRYIHSSMSTRCRWTMDTTYLGSIRCSVRSLERSWWFWWLCKISFSTSLVHLGPLLNSIP